MRYTYFLFRDPDHKDNTGPTPTAPALIGQETDEQIAAWKAKHTLGIYAIKVGGHIAYFKMPDFDDLNHGYSKLDQDKALDIWKALGETTMLGGSADVLNNPTLFAGAMRKIQKKADGIEAELVDL